MNSIVGADLQVQDAILTYQLDGQGGYRPITEASIASEGNPVWLHVNYENTASAEWLASSKLIPEAIRDSLLGQSSRPRITKVNDGLLITLRSINFDSDNLPDPMVTVRVYITGQLIISSRCRKISAVNEINNALQNNVGPENSGDWLVSLADELTDHASEFIDNLHAKIIELEDNVLEQRIPERGDVTLLRKQLIILRRYLLPQRDVFARLAIEKIAWMDDQDRHRMREAAERLGRGLDDLDASIARTTILSDEINALMAEAVNRRTYTMSILAMVFLPATFLTGLFGVNLSGIPASESKWSFAIFSIILITIALGIGWWLRRSKWL